MNEDDATDVDAQGKYFGAQTLARGLDVVQRVEMGDTTLAKIAKSLNLNKTTVHRLITTLVDARYLSYNQSDGYALGARLLELGDSARQQISLTRVSRDYLRRLASDTGDTVNLGILDRDQVYYLEKIPGTRRIEVRCHIGERMPLRPTGLGKALLLDEAEDRLREIYLREAVDFPGYRYDLRQFLELMRGYKDAGYALDMDENGEHVRCVAVPIRDHKGSIAAAVSVSSAIQYMTDERMSSLINLVKQVANDISLELGFRGSPETPSQ